MRLSGRREQQERFTSKKGVIYVVLVRKMEIWHLSESHYDVNDSLNKIINWSL